MWEGEFLHVLFWRPALLWGPECRMHSVMCGPSCSHKQPAALGPGTQRDFAHCMWFEVAFPAPSPYGSPTACSRDGSCLSELPRPPDPALCLSLWPAAMDSPCNLTMVQNEDTPQIPSHPGTPTSLLSSGPCSNTNAWNGVGLN